MTYRMQLEIRNRRNDQLRLTYLMADRTEVFTAIYECARKHHAAFAKDLIAWCDLTASGFEEYRDGPRAWLLLLRELAGKGERSKSDQRPTTSRRGRCSKIPSCPTTGPALRL